jgi:hypothetical protein
MSHSRIKLLACVAALALTGAQAPAAFAADKVKIESAAQLPRQTYTVSQKPSVFIQDAAAVRALARKLDTDVVALLNGYDIQDRATLEGLYGVRLQVALLENRWADAKTLLEQTAAIREKPAEKATSGLTTYALLAASQAAGTPEAKRAAYRAALTQRLSGMDYALVEARVKATKSSFELMNPGLLGASLEATLDPIWSKSPEFSREMASALVGAYVTFNQVAPYKDEAVAAINGYLAKHASAAPRADIWTARTVALPEAAKLTPVAIAIWDSGVDAPVFKNRLWKNPKEKANGRDDDGNGFVDDLHGIGYETDFARSGATLRPGRPGVRRQARGTARADEGLARPAGRHRQPRGGGPAAARGADEAGGGEELHRRLDLLWQLRPRQPRRRHRRGGQPRRAHPAGALHHEPQHPASSDR